MNRLLILLIVVCGFAAGWLLPVRAPDRSEVGASEHEISRQARIRQSRKRELLPVLLDDDDLVRHRLKRATSLFGVLGGLRGISYPHDSELARIVDMGAAAAMDELLADPSSSLELCERITTAWAHRSPEEAIRFLRTKQSYRAEDCLDEALICAYRTNPKLVGEVLRSKSRRWQKRHLKDLFSQSYRVRAAGAPPEIESDDPFFDDGYWRTISVGEDLLDDLADDELREMARAILGEVEPETVTVDPSSVEPEKQFDVRNFDRDDWGQRGDLSGQLSENREETLAEIVEHGNFEARTHAISHLIGTFPMDPESWPVAFAKVEDWMELLGVIPQYQPSHFEMGPFLRGKVAAEWINRQPLGLQRAWSPTFTETWAQSDPLAAINWARALPQPAARDEAVQSGLIVWAHSQPRAATAYVETLPPGDLRESAISNAAAAWSRVDPPGATAWLDSLPDSPGKTRARARVK